MRKAQCDKLTDIPNVGPATAADLHRLGVRSVEDLKGRNPQRLYDDLCAKDGLRHDICLLDVFTSAVSFANGEKPRPWWEFSRERKAAAKPR